MKNRNFNEEALIDVEKFEKYVRIALRVAAALSLGMFLAAVARAECINSYSAQKEPVVYSVDTSIPKHLQGATITVTLANGESTTVPAEKFMVVPRKQKTVVGENTVIMNKLVCSGSKNELIAEARKDITGFKTEAKGNRASIYSERELVPGINYYRRELFDTNFGAGVGVDANGTVKLLLGTEF